MTIRTREISNSDDTIDSRDVIARIEELRSDLESAIGDSDHDSADEIRDELAPLEKVASDGESLSDWQYGVTLVRDSYFESYARDLAEDMSGEAIRNASWPFNHIDWDAAAEALKIDYTEIDFDGVAYYAR